MVTEFSPQFTLDDLYISPFTAERYYDDKTGEPIYRPVERNITPTRIHMMDAYLQIVCTSKSYTRNTLEQRLGVPLIEFSVMCRLLTGLPQDELHDALRLRLADDLLRYTSLDLRDIAFRCGFSAYSGLSKLFEKKYHCSVSERQKKVRGKNDEGRYRI